MQSFKGEKNNQPRLSSFVVLHNLQDDIPRLLDASLGADDLNRLTLALGAGYLDLGASLLPDAVDLGAAGPDNVAVGTGVGEDKVADSVLLLCLLEGLLDLGASGSDGFGGGADEHPRDVTLLG